MKPNEQKEKTNDLSIKNSRLWAKEQIRLNHDKMMVKRKSKDNENESEQCKNEVSEGTFVFPAMEIFNEIEDKEDTTCIDTNRDELLKSFCSFTSNLDNLFQIQNISKKQKHFGLIYVVKNAMIMISRKHWNLVNHQEVAA